MLNQKIVKLQLDNEGLQSDFHKLQNSEKPVSLVEIEEELSVLTDLKLKFTKMGNAIADIRSETIEKSKSYASVAKGLTVSNDVDIDTIFDEQTQRSVKEKYVFISGIDFSSLQEGESVLSAVSDLISSIDENIKLSDCKRMKSKAANSYINKAIVTLNSVACKDKLINKSKSVLKGKGIYINPDLTKLQMEDYKLRQEKYRLISNMTVDEKTISQFTSKGKQSSSMIN